MPITGHHTDHEIQSQPESWRAALKVLEAEHGALTRLGRDLRAHAQPNLLIAGCGSTFYLAQAAAVALQAHTGLPARALPASEVWLNEAATLRGARTALLAVSRSGETTETLRACEAYRDRGLGPIVTLSCYPGRPLPELGDLNLVLPSGQEESVAQTRAFSTLYLTTLYLAALWGEDAGLVRDLTRLPQAGADVIERSRGLAESLGRDAEIDRFYFLGSGLRYGLAGELSLKMKEMSLSHSEPFHMLEFRHGPMSMVTPNTLIVAQLSDAQGEAERAVIADMRRLGARILTIAEKDADFDLASGLGETARSLLALPIGQRMAFARSVSKGLDPDRPHNLETVVKLG
ncbi:MAG TPA: SIS domain-containing protein [Anaerolineales bacterium]|nr:SIS domain-containing protein [Anaerolineales bacterium]